VLVFGDVDVPSAVEGIVGAAFYNAGQDCTAASRVLVQENVHDSFVSALAARVAKQSTGPLNSAAQLARVTGLLDRLPGHAVVHCGGKRLGGAGFFLEPTVVSGLRQDDEIVQEEIFAPVITVQRFASDDDGVAMANDVPQGLASSVWTSDVTRAARVSTELDFGCVWINTHGPLASEMPHGGFGQSGYGKDLSVSGLTDYTRVKHVMTCFA
jgi:betaine-aldehyde dehydrogenase